MPGFPRLRRQPASARPTLRSRGNRIAGLAALAALWLAPHIAAAAGPNPLQRLIDRARPGAVVTVPPGIYQGGARIAKSLTLRMKGAFLRGNVGGKGVISVRIDGGRVAIEDFTATDGLGCASGNCAGIKIEGRGFHVTLRRAHIANQVMGVLTDNRGGTLIIDSSLIEEEGHPNGALSHLVYAGEIDRLAIHNSTLRRSRHLGHLLKSRALETVVERSFVLGLDGRHSRSIDMPCGGALVVRDSVIQHGRSSDNADVIAIGTEPKICGNVRPGDVILENSWIISDHRAVAVDPAKPPARNTLFTWRSTGANRLRARGNRIVNIARWRGDASWGVPDLAPGNTVFADRAAAGLGRDEIPPLPPAH